MSGPRRRPDLRRHSVDAANRIEDLSFPPGNRPEKLHGDREGQHSIRINEIVHGQRSISADTALRLARYFGTSEGFWMNLQVRFDLEVEKDRLGEVLDREVVVLDQAV